MTSVGCRQPYSDTDSDTIERAFLAGSAEVVTISSYT
jgi:hypothetical protein